MRHFVLCMAVVGLAMTGCAQNQVFGPMAQKGGQNLRQMFAKKKAQPATESAAPSQGDVQLAGYCGGSDGCCEYPGGSCDCGDGCDGGCCDSGCCGSCSSGMCGSGGRGRSGGKMRDRCRQMCGGMAGINPHAGGYPEAQNFNPSPPSGQVAYPYYTTRGPRDFLQSNPPSIGPY